MDFMLFIFKETFDPAMVYGGLNVYGSIYIVYVYL